jgi:hypothetical protein
MSNLLSSYVSVALTRRPSLSRPMLCVPLAVRAAGRLPDRIELVLRVATAGVPSPSYRCCLNPGRGPRAPPQCHCYPRPPVLAYSRTTWRPQVAPGRRASQVHPQLRLPRRLDAKAVCKHDRSQCVSRAHRRFFVLHQSGRMSPSGGCRRQRSRAERLE